MLTKSYLQSFAQCPRKLWLEVHSPEHADADDSSMRRRAIDGNLVGEKAREQLGPNFIWPPARAHRDEAATEAKALLQAAPGESGAEVPMVRSEVYARADALVKEGAGYVLRETKSSSFPLKPDKQTPGKPDEHHLEDVAIQAWVMAESGIPMTRAELNFLNSRWRYPGNGDYSGLFRQLDVTKDIADHLPKVPVWVSGATATLAGKLPDLRTGKHCTKPYDCQFQEYCATLEPEGPDHPIELLPDSAGKALAKKLRDAGFTSIVDVPSDRLTGAQSALYQRIQAAHKSGKAILVPGTAEIMKQLPYPRYYFDFEGIDLPVPQWRGVRPFEQIPFQWSCHIERSAGVFEHAEFLELSGSDPSVACIERMREVIADDGGPILVYHATYEKGRINGLGERHPEHKALMDIYASRIVDLLPIVKEHFYHPSMEGSFSIKKVLPVIAPDLDYKDLAVVQEGTGAQVAYIDAALNKETPPARRAQIENALRLYCRQDTWAMVEIGYFLARSGRPKRPNER